MIYSNGFLDWRVGAIVLIGFFILPTMPLDYQLIATGISYSHISLDSHTQLLCISLILF